MAAEAEAAAAAVAAPPAPLRRRRPGQGRAPRPGEHRQAGKVATVRVGTDRLDALMNLMGEMVIQRTRLAQLSAEHDLGDLRGAVEDMTRVTNDLQSLIMQVRMMPVDAVFMRFPRMVRDLANTLGKRLDLQISGEDTELDRTVIDGLGDPLVHMLRNAVDHGLELPERPRRGRQGPGRRHPALRPPRRQQRGDRGPRRRQGHGPGRPARLRGAQGPDGPGRRRRAARTRRRST